MATTVDPIVLNVVLNQAYDQTFQAVHWDFSPGDPHDLSFVPASGVNPNSYNILCEVVSVNDGTVRFYGTALNQLLAGQSITYGAVVATQRPAAGGNSTTTQGTVTLNIAAPASGNVTTDYGSFAATLGAPFVLSLASYYKHFSGWAATNLPPGLTVDNTGTIRGTPTTTGTFAVTVTATGNNGNNQTLTGTLSITVNALPDSSASLTVDTGSGAVTVAQGVASAFFGEQKGFSLGFTPAPPSGSVTNVTFTLKEKSEALQYLALLGGTASGDGASFQIPSTVFAGDALLNSLLLYDEVEPSLSVVYSLEIFYRFNGQPRKSVILDFTVYRPQDLDFAVAGDVVPGSGGGGGGGGNPVPVAYEAMRPDIKQPQGGTPGCLDALAADGFPLGFCVKFVYQDQLAIYELRSVPAGTALPGDDHHVPAYRQSATQDSSIPYWYRVQ